MIKINSLATKYRPNDFESVCGQKSIVKILNKQIETDNISNCMIFYGPSGTGKTTLARIFSNKVNNNCGEPIEIDAASNNGVDNVRLIVDQAIERSLDSKYKVFIIDECHQITSAGWNAFLKCIEEPPKYTLFIFCTTDINKVPDTIINRCQTYGLGRLDIDDIYNRLIFICNEEHFNYENDAIKYIANISEGSLRLAISYLDKCKDYSTVLNLTNIIDCLGEYSYDIYFNLTNSIIDGNDAMILTIIDDLYKRGSNLKLFILKYLEFVLQVQKFNIFKDISVTTIPSSYKDKLEYTVNIGEPKKYFNYLLDKIMKLNKIISNNSESKTIIESVLITR